MESVLDDGKRREMVPTHVLPSDFGPRFGLCWRLVLGENGANLRDLFFSILKVTSYLKDIFIILRKN